MAKVSLEVHFTIGLYNQIALEVSNSVWLVIGIQGKGTKFCPALDKEQFVFGISIGIVGTLLTKVVLGDLPQGYREAVFSIFLSAPEIRIACTNQIKL